MSDRIAPASGPYSAPIQERLDKLMPPGVPPLALFRTLARDERLFLRFIGTGLLDRGNLSIRERELVILRVCANNRSEYEWGVHAAGFATKAGFSNDQLKATVRGSPADGCWAERDSLLLRLCDTLHESSEISEALWQELRTSFSEEAVLELLMLIGQYRTVSIMTNGLRLPLEPWAQRFPS
jgi:alkylhydroperoxidase family enzyme